MNRPAEEAAIAAFVAAGRVRVLDPVHDPIAHGLKTWQEQKTGTYAASNSAMWDKRAKRKRGRPRKTQNV